MRKAEMISEAGKANPSKPFIIFDSCNQLKKIYKEHPDLDEPKIFNCDETGFPTDQSGEKVISVKRERAFKLSFRARRKNITTVGMCNANRAAIDPLIILKGKCFMSNWCE